MPASCEVTPTSMPASRTAGTAWMWSQWPCVSMTLRTFSRWHSSSSLSCSLAASINTASPVSLQRTTNTLLSMGPTTSLWISARGSSTKSVEPEAAIAGQPTTRGSACALTDRSSKFPRRSIVASSRPRGIAVVNFAFSEEQEELRRSVRRFLEGKCSETEVRRLIETTDGYDPAVWKQMGAQLGLQGLAIPEEFGGSGYGYVELTVVFEEMGRALLPAPYFSTVALAANALLASGDDAAKKEYLPGIASGETIATLAFTEDSGRWDEEGITLEAKGSGSDYTLSGHKMFVIDGHTANLIIVAARTGAGISLFAVEADASGVTRTPLTTMDQTRK